ncbi:unnamed protein product [Protopolystoma xenopodis]|uniref:Uncharacterized protein n=1 Tax=Protopolystoma xenopodis TaxID=117903 RepID=A0A448WRV5_9PLAT|nr:unnamed protein product [Protopolystoma xenopodis]
MFGPVEHCPPHLISRCSTSSHSNSMYDSLSGDANFVHGIDFHDSFKRQNPSTLALWSSLQDPVNSVCSEINYSDSNALASGIVPEIHIWPPGYQSTQPLSSTKYIATNANAFSSGIADSEIVCCRQLTKLLRQAVGFLELIGVRNTIDNRLLRRAEPHSCALHPNFGKQQRKLLIPSSPVPDKAVLTTSCLNPSPFPFDSNKVEESSQILYRMWESRMVNWMPEHGDRINTTGLGCVSNPFICKMMPVQAITSGIHEMVP